MDTEMTKVRVMIADRSYPLMLKQNDVESVQKAAGVIQENIREFRKKYDGKDMQDYLSMVLLKMVVENLSAQNENTHDITIFNQKMEQLERMLSAAI